MNKADILYELNEKIQSCQHIIDDLKTLGRVYDTEYDEDQVLNILIGLETLYEHKFKELNQSFQKAYSNLL